MDDRAKGGRFLGLRLGAAHDGTKERLLTPHTVRGCIEVAAVQEMKPMRPLGIEI